MTTFKHRMTFVILAGIIGAFSTAAYAQTTPNPTATQTADGRARGFCSDPWVTLAILFVNAGTRVPQGTGNLGECNTQLYNGGSWSSYDQLVKAVRANQAATNNVFSMTDNHDGTLTIITNLGSGFQSWVQESGKIVSQGAGNIVAQGAGNIVSTSGSNIILNGGGNYKVQSVDQKAIILPGNRVLVVTRATTAPKH